MKAHLMFADADFDPTRPEPPHAGALIADLGLDTVLAAMAAGDRFLHDVARSALLAPLADPAGIAYRQHVVADCLANEDVVQALYDLAVRTLEDKKKTGFWGFWHASPSSVLSSATSLLAMLEDKLRQLRAIADTHAPRFHSEGFGAFFAAIADEIDDDYLDLVAGHVRTLRFGRGVRFSARLGAGNKARDFLVRAAKLRGGLRGLLLGTEDGPSYAVTVPERDDGGAQELGELRDQALNPLANAVAQAADHIVSFFTQLRAELALHLGCVNLHHALTEAGTAVCFPTPVAPGERALTARGLYDPALPLRGAQRVVGNDLDADGRPLVVITGANQGGKSTFLRAVAVAELMAAAGMPVPADVFRFSPASGVFTHYRRSEDASMVHGKFEEELARMRRIVEQARSGGLVAMNESFASTNEREGAEVAVPVIEAFLDAGLRVLLVTHSFELAGRLLAADGGRAVFLRAQRLADGSRTFRLAEGPPLSTSFGADLYREVFAAPLDQPSAQVMNTQVESHP